MGGTEEEGGDAEKMGRNRGRGFTSKISNVVPRFGAEGIFRQKKGSKRAGLGKKKGGRLDVVNRRR